MNYLAHLFLSDWTPESLLGNLLGDFVKGEAKNFYNDEIVKGIKLHQKIDIFTDSHPIVRGSKRVISLPRRRFSGIMIDVFYDHFLAKNWDDYGEISLGEFSRRAYQALHDNREILPESLKLRLPDIIDGDLLSSYKEFSGIEQALRRLSARIKWKNNLADGVEELALNYQQLESDFRAFFPDLIQYANACRSQSSRATTQEA